MPGGTTVIEPSAPSTSAYSCHPSMPKTVDPTGRASVRLAMTSPMPPLRTTSPMPMGGRYPGASSIHVRMVGSMERCWTLTRACPSPGSGTVAESSMRSVEESTRPLGRAASRIRR